MPDPTAASANSPRAKGGRAYHLETRPGEIAPRCILVGSPKRARDAARQLLTDVRCRNNGRQLRCYTGNYQIPEGERVRVSIVTTGMGGPSFSIVMDEAIDGGGRVFVRVGSCSALKPDAEVGGLTIVEAAVRFDGCTDTWLPLAFPAVCNRHVVRALETAAIQFAAPHQVGTEVTTSDFIWGQGRKDKRGYIPPELAARHELMMRYAHCYSMEAATGAILGLIRGGYPFAAVNANFGNRATDAFQKGAGEDLACRVGIDAIARLNPDLIVPAALR